MIGYLAFAFLIAAFLLWEMREVLFILIGVAIAASIVAAIFRPKRNTP